ncbi:hypothetical protein [Rhodococcus sp. B10]|uniref:hypothetical protein n=1 Tax=Rhodococcus sp. B10 TaxID=2695876 RepID=UPI0014317047|nr:hypothetical protein [Rhodococcus sp. B10]NIL77581.1 hypothetical protein [Rhodococcus sp. B10]
MPRTPSAKITLAATVGVILALTAIPVLRLTGADTALRLPILAAIALVTIVTVVKDRGTTLRPGVIVALGMFIVSGSIANLRANDSYQWLTLAAFAGIAIAGLVLGASVRAHGVERPVFRWVIGVAAAQSLYAIYEVVSGAEPLWRGANIRRDGESIRLQSTLIDGFERAQGTLGHPLVLAALALIAVSMIVATDAVAKAHYRVALIVLLAGGIVASGSRNAVLVLIALVLVTWGASTWGAMAARGLFFGVPLALIGLALSEDRIRELLDSGSFTHRAGAIAVVPRLSDVRGFLSMAFGDGSASTPRLLNAGLLQSDRFLAIDNQFLLLFIQYGLAGLVLICGLIFAAIQRDAGAVRLMLVVWIAQFFIFDVLAWPSSAILLWLCVGLAYSRRAPSQDNESVEDRAVERAYA